MNNSSKVVLAEAEIEEIELLVKSACNDGKIDVAKERFQQLLRAQKHQLEAAISLVRIVDEQYLPIEESLEILDKVYEVHKSNKFVVSLIGSALESARDIDHLNIAPPEHPLFKIVVEDLITSLKTGNQDEEMILNGLSTAGRMVSRQYDSVTEESYRRLIELDPNSSSYHYCLGLFCKTRGLFKEGMLANQKAAALVEETNESQQWNLGICATGAGEPEVALEVWKRMGNKLEMGRFNLPEGSYPYCKVRLAQYPLAERNAENDAPGNEETIWIERLSPCHGIVRSVLYQDLGVDYGDVVLIDGAPITYHKYGEDQVPVFPHLTTLIRNNYVFYDFAATQNEEGQIGELSSSLDSDAVVYVHTENYRVLCSTCWRDPDANHQQHLKDEKRIVTGRIAAPNDVAPKQLLSQLDGALKDLEHCELYAPELSEIAGLKERARVDRYRFELLVDN